MLQKYDLSEWKFSRLDGKLYHCFASNAKRKLLIIMAIQSCATWECVNSFANWLSAVGTILITGLALWLSVRDRQINLRSRLTFGAVPSSDRSVLDRAVFVLSFTNVGMRPVTVTNHCWEIPLVKGITFLHPYSGTEVSHLCSKIPLELTDGKEGIVFYPMDFFKKLERANEFLFHSNKYIAWMRIRFFKVRIVTTAGPRPTVEIDLAVRRILWQQYNENSV